MAKHTIKIDKINWLIDIIVISCFLAFIFIGIPIKTALFFNPDEGHEIMKSLLVLEKYPLYNPTWGDQMPLQTWLLAAYLRVFSGEIVYNARIYTLIFSCLLIFCFRRIITFYFNQIISILAVIILLCSNYFLILSVSAMQAIPCLSLGICSIYLVIIQQTKKDDKKNIVYLVLSGTLLGLGIANKLFMIVLIPVMISYLITDHGKISRFLGIHHFNDLSREINNSLVWLGSVLITVLFIILLIFISIGYFPHENILGTHLSEKIYKQLNLFKMLIPNFKDEKYIFITAIAGLFLSLKYGFNKIFIPLVWLVCDLILFWDHTPMWYHYYVMFSLPLIWLSSYFLFWCFSVLNVNLKSLTRNSSLLKDKKFGFKQIFKAKKVFTIIKSTIIILLLGKIFGLVKGDLISMSKKISKWDRGTEETRQLVRRISKYKPKSANKWIYVDNAILAVHADVLIPPKVALFSKKRTKDKYDYENELYESIKQYQPQQIILTTFLESLDHKELQNYVDENYDLIVDTERVKHYLLKTIIP